MGRAFRGFLENLGGRKLKLKRKKERQKRKKEERKKERKNVKQQVVFKSFAEDENYQAREKKS